MYKELVNSIALFNKFRKHQFAGNEDEKYVIEAIEIQAIKQFDNIDAYKITNLNRQIIKYMDQREEKDYETFTNYLVKSKLIKPLNLNIEKIRAKTLKDLEEIRNVIKFKTT